MEDSTGASTGANTLGRKASDARFLLAVQAIMDREGYKTTRQFLLAHALNPNLINKIKTGLQSAPADIVADLALRYGLNLNYIYLGTEPMFTGQQMSQPQYGQTYDVPFLSLRAWASFPDQYLDDEMPTVTERLTLLLDEAPKPGSMAVEVQGDSMADQLKEGTRVLVSPVERGDWPYLNAGVFVVLLPNKLVIKRIKENTLRRQGTVVLHSDNPKSGSLEVTAEDLRQIWQVDRVVSAHVS